MSAYPNSDRESGLPQTVMSALPPKADMCTAQAHVCFGPKADIGRQLRCPLFARKQTLLLFCLGPNAFIQEARAVLHFDLLLLHPLFALAHLQCLINWHHLFRSSGLHAIRHLR